MNTNLLITGSYPPDICGVGDYVYNVFNNADHSKWELYYSKSWDISTFISKIREINNSGCKCIYMQYPTHGYGWSIVPQLLCLYFSLFTKKKFIVILHEFSQRKLKAKIATALFMFADRIIFTNKFEQQYATKRFLGVKHKSHVVKILSNIAASENTNNWCSREYDLCYFGLIQPNKGLEDFYNTVKQLFGYHKKLRIAIIGQVTPDYSRYFEQLKSTYTDMCVEYKLNQSSEKVSEYLNSTKITYLPFPDGSSERRGSFLAAISNGSVVVSTPGKFLTDDLKSTAIIVDKNYADSVVSQILERWTDREYIAYRDKLKKYFMTLPDNWQDIVNKYETIL